MKNQANQAFDATHTLYFRFRNSQNSDFCTLQVAIEPSLSDFASSAHKRAGKHTVSAFRRGVSQLPCTCNRHCAFTAHCIVVCRLITAFLHRCARIGHHFSFLRLLCGQYGRFFLYKRKKWRLQSQKGRFMPGNTLRLRFLVRKSLLRRHMAPFLPRDRQNRRQRRISITIPCLHRKRAGKTAKNKARLLPAADCFRIASRRTAFQRYNP